VSGADEAGRDTPARAEPRTRQAAAGAGAPRVLLVESLDAAGSDRLDARERCAALRALRAVVRVAVLGPRGADAGPGAGAAMAAAGAFAEWDAGPLGFARLREFTRKGRFDLVLVASAAPGGGPVALALPREAPVVWWPTGVAPAPGWRARLGFHRAPARPPLAEVAGPDPQAPTGLAWSTVGSRKAGRGGLTLWDGEYLLAPLPLAGEDGSRLLAAFAGLADQWCGLDLVVLGEPRAEFEREARARGVGPRVHFAGPAPREAEWAWWAHAAGAVLAGAGAVSGGLVLRGLRSGCPMLAAQSDAPGAAIRAWLERTGCTAVRGTEGGRGLVAALTRVLERGPAVMDAVARGRSLAAAHGEDRLPARLAAALPGLVAGRSAGRRGAAA
jgi:hypothetical protein